jgi:hypothetical protein
MESEDLYEGAEVWVEIDKLDDELTFPFKYVYYILYIIFLKIGKDK